MRKHIVSALSATLLVAALAGCAATSTTDTGHGKASGTSAPSANTAAQFTMHGDGPQEQQKTIPSGTHSVKVAVDCAGGGMLSITTNSDSSRIGTCDGQATYTLPTPDQPVLRLGVVVPAGVTVTATADWSKTLVHADADLRTLCDDVAKASQAASNGTDAALGDVTAPADLQDDVNALTAAFAKSPSQALGSGAMEHITAACINNDTPVTTTSSVGG